MSKFAQPSGRAQKAGTIHISRVWGSVFAIACFLLLGACRLRRDPRRGCEGS